MDPGGSKGNTGELTGTQSQSNAPDEGIAARILSIFDLFSAELTL